MISDIHDLVVVVELNLPPNWCVSIQLHEMISDIQIGVFLFNCMK